MIITILLCLLSDLTVAAAVSDLTVAAEKYRFERLQGQCSAWCYQRYGFWETHILVNLNSVPLYSCADVDEECVEISKCKETDRQCIKKCTSYGEECLACNRACSHDFNNLAECYVRCGEPAHERPEPCLRGCEYHQAQSRVEVDDKFRVAYQKNLSKNYPTDIHKEESTESSIQLKWGHMDQFSDPTAIVFLVFLFNITSSDFDDSSIAKTQGLYIGSTPLHDFNTTNLSSDYCYIIRIITVTPDSVLGSGASNRRLATKGVVHTENITATSVTIWFRIRPCEIEIIDHSLSLVYQKLDLDEYKSSGRSTYSHSIILLKSVTEQSVIKADVTGLTPNTEYRISVDRKYKETTHNDLYPQSGGFKTLSAAPESDVEITTSEITPTSMKFNFELSQFWLTWDTDIAYYSLRLRQQDGEYSDPKKIPSTLKSDHYTENNLNPYVTYCASMAVGNEFGLGPYNAEETCTTTLSAAAPAPEVSVINRTALHVWVEVTRPHPPNGLLSYYNISFIDTDRECEPCVVKYPLENGNKQKMRIEQLSPATDYKFNVQAVNSLDQLGLVASVQVTTRQSYPEKAPEVSTCSVSSNKTHASAIVTWINIDDDLINGEIEYYAINLVQQRSDNPETIEVVANKTYYPSNWDDGVLEVYDDSLKLEYTEQEEITARLAIATHVGPGPWSEPFQCEIVAPASMSKDVTTPVIIVVCIAGVCIFLVFVFMYFFRFKPYKKTPYEEIPKLIAPDTFNPCQHCLQNREPKRWDVFICHVSEDTDYIVKLKDAFVREKIEVFFAKDELSWGCELHRVINDGLRFSKYGLVVLSKQFVSKCSKWTSSELSSLHSKSKITSQDCILPIWKKDISEVDVGEFDMTLVGIKALKEEEMTVDQMAMELKKKLKNDGCWGCSLRIIAHNSGGSTPKSSDDEPLIGVSTEDVELSSPDDAEHFGTNV